MILGGIAFGVFLLFVVIKICLDEKKRHIAYAAQVDKAKRTLHGTLNQSPEDMDRYAREFDELERSGGAKQENDDEADLIN